MVKNRSSSPAARLRNIASICFALDTLDRKLPAFVFSPQAGYRLPPEATIRIKAQMMLRHKEFDSVFRKLGNTFELRTGAGPTAIAKFWRCLLSFSDPGTVEMIGSAMALS